MFWEVGALATRRRTLWMSTNATKLKSWSFSWGPQRLLEALSKRLEGPWKLLVALGSESALGSSWGAKISLQTAFLKTCDLHKIVVNLGKNNANMSLLGALGR